MPDAHAPLPRLGIIGTGSVARMHADGLAELGIPFAIHGRSGAADFAVDYAPLARPVSSWEELLAESEVIDVCTPTPTHVDIAGRAIAAGRHVICEKPLALTAEEASALADAADAQGVRLLPAHVVRFFPAYAALRETVRSGGLGKIVTARFTRAGHSPRWSDWFHDEEKSGSILVDQMIHDIDQAIDVLGPVTRVNARRRSGEDGVSTGLVVLTHAGGAFSHIVGLWGPRRTPFRSTYHVVGTAGVLSHDSAAAPSLRVRGRSAPEEGEDIHIDAGALSPFAAELSHLLHAIATGTPAIVDARDGVAATAVAEAALISARTGRTVRLDLEEAAR